MIDFNNIILGQEQQWLEDHFDGIYYTDDDAEPCSHSDLTSFILSGFFDFCGCGCREESLKFTKSGLNHIQNRTKKIQENHGEQLKLIWEEIKKEENSIFGSTGAAYFFYYWCDKEGLTEHGGSVPGWLTIKGEFVLNILTLNNELEQIQKDSE